MKILLVNKFHYLKGGSEKYYFELAELLRENGHEIAFFSMENEKNIKTNEKEYFVKNINLNSQNKLKAFDVIYSKENKKKMEEAIQDFKPDIVHLNNFQRQLSASIIDAIKEKDIPIIYTAHDLQAICPAITMLDSNKNICEDCKKGKYSNCIRKKCIKSSTLKSILGAIEGKYYDQKKIYKEKIDYIITPSECYREKLIEEGIDKNKILAHHNFIDMEKYEIETQEGDYALYFGRLSKEKGILNLVQAFEKRKKGKLYIAGEGEEKQNIENRIKEKHLEKHIQLLGFLNQEEIRETIGKCKFVIVPSVWYENCPYSILETLAIGKPVIGANIGGIPELVKNEENGLTYSYNNIEELSDKIDQLFSQPELVKIFSKNAKENAKKLYSKQIYYDTIISVYDKLLKERK